jgi:hypothetical protein
MAVIGATQLEPVNVLGQYVQGLEAGRGAQMQRRKEAQELAAMQREADFRNFLSTADLSTPEARNQLMRFGKPGAEFAANLAEIESRQATTRKTGLEADKITSEMADENYGRFQREIGNLAYGEIAPSKDEVLDRVDFMIERGMIAPQFRDYATSTLSDDPALLQKQLRGQFLSQVPPADRAKLFVPRSPEVYEQDLGERMASRPISTTNVTNIAERAEAGKFGESLVADYTAIRDRAESGRRFLTTIDQAQRALSEGLRTGFGAEAVKQGARFLAALGEPEAEKKAANAELFLAAAKENVLRRQIEQKGPQTESDAARIEETFISLGTTPRANQFMLDVAREQIKRDGEQQRFYAKWRRDNGTFDGAEEAWLEGEGSKSLFDRPALKKYATPEAAGQGPAVGTVEGGYRFKGGDPANQKNWEKVR